MVGSCSYRGKIAALAGALLGAGLLAGCDAATTSAAQSLSASEHRAEAARIGAQGSPQFADPKLQAIVRDFEAEYARYGRDAEKLAADAGALCPLAPEEAFKLLKQVGYAEMQAEYAKWGVTSLTDLDAIEVRVVSGDCDAQGVEGPAEIVGRSRGILRTGSGELERVTVTDSVERIRGSWAGGERRGPFRTIAVSRSASFEPGAAGGLAAEATDWAYLAEMRDAPTAMWLYMSHGPAFAADPVVTFTRNPEAALFGTTVVERRADGTGYSRMYQGSELRMEGPTRNGKMHGWQVRHPHSWQGHAVAGGRDCWQDGELVKTTTCPGE
ncbi:MAG: hypothetical protein WD341_10510 [Tistlia sp.]|uniref:hypothetical protein n=1 Tax=Tistlia sp. TaxID=3057121 RepID=UPI0034A17BD5